MYTPILYVLFWYVTNCKLITCDGTPEEKKNNVKIPSFSYVYFSDWRCRGMRHFVLLYVMHVIWFQLCAPRSQITEFLLSSVLADCCLSGDSSLQDFRPWRHMSVAVEQDSTMRAVVFMPATRVEMSWCNTNIASTVFALLSCSFSSKPQHQRSRRAWVVFIVPSGRTRWVVGQLWRAPTAYI